MRRSGAHVAALAAAALLALTGCDDDPTGPSPERVAGTYNATEFTVTTGSGVEDLLAAGADITITLNADGTTTGALYVPALAGQAEVSESLAGTWSLAGNRVTFTQQADTFLRDMTFEWDDGVLAGSELFAGALIEVEMTRGGS